MVNYKRKRSTKRRPRRRMKRPTFAKRVKRVILRNQEKKWLEVAVNESIDNNGVMIPLMTLNPIQGDGEGERIGNRIDLTSIQWRGQLIDAGSTTVGVSVTRIIMFQWADGNTTPTITGAEGLLQTIPLNVSPYNRQNVKEHKFRIMFDMTVTTSQGAYPAKTWNKNYTKGFTKKLIFEDATTIGIWKPWIFMVSETTSTPLPALDGIMSFNYVDA